MSGRWRSVDRPLVALLLDNQRWWTWCAVLSSILLCSAISWIHFQQRDVVDRTSEWVQSFRQARLDLAKGFLHVSYANERGAPFDREQGVALLDQALAAMRAALTSGDPDRVIDRREASLLRSFDRAAEEFRAKIATSGLGDLANPAVATALRIAYHRLEQQCDQIDDHNRQDLHRITSRLDRRFQLLLALAAVLLGAVCLGTYAANRGHERSVLALRASEDQLQSAVASLKDERQFLSDLIENSGALVMVKNRDGTYRLVNRRWEEVTRLTREQVLGRTDLELFPLGDGETFRANDQAVMDSGRTQSLEEVLAADSGTRTFLSVKFPIRDAGGGVTGVCGMISEITEQKRAAVLVDGQRRVLEMIARDAPLADTLEELLRVLEEAVPGMLTSILLVDPETGCLRHGAAPSLPEAYNRAMDGIAIGPEVGCCGTSAYRGETVIVEDIAGDPLWAGYPELRDLALEHGLRSCWSTPIFDRERQVVGTFAIYFREVTRASPDHHHVMQIALHTASICLAHHRAESDLRESERRFRQRVESLPQLVWTCSPEGACDYLGRQWVEYTGIPEAPQLGIGWVEQVHPDDRKLVLDTWWATAGVGEVYQCELRLRRHDGVYRWFDTRAVPLRDPDGRVSRWFGSNTDITERKLAEAMLRQSEERFSRVFHTSPAALAILKVADGSYLDVNPAFSAVTGFARDEIVGRAIGGGQVVQADLLPSGDGAPQVRSSIYNYETTWLHKSGELRHVLASIEPIELDHEACLLTTAVDITERKRAEERLRESELRYRSLVEQAADGIFVSDAVGRCVDVNSAGCAMLGYTREEVLELSLSDLVTREERAHLRSEAAKTLGGKVIRGEWQFRRKDGSHFPGEVAARRLPDGRVQSILRDITDRKRDEAERQQLSILIENSTDFIAMADLEGHHTYLNAGGRRMVGIDPQTEPGDVHFLDYVPESWREFFLGTVVQTTLERGRWEGEMKLANLKTGEVLDVSRSTFLVRDPRTQQPLCFATVTRDITERKRAERRRTTQNAVSRVLAFASSLGEVAPRILEALADAEGWDLGTIWEIDDEAGVLRCREVWHRAGVPARKLAERTRHMVFARGEGLPGRVWQAEEICFVRDVSQDTGYPRAALAIQAGLRSAIAFPILKGGTVTGVVDFLARELHEPDPGLREMFAALGRQLGVFIQRRQAEEEVRRLNTQLEHRVAERTAQLEAANRELEAFSYSVSHDLRAPLRAMDGFSLAALEDFGPGMPEHVRGYLETIRSQAQRMGQLIDDLLTFSRLSRAPIAAQSVDTDSLVRSLLPELRALHAGRRIEVRIGELPECEGDPALLRQVWVNLIGNAFKYTGRREQARVEIGCTGDGKHDVYFVRDNGAGFDMRYAHKLFGVFQRLHRAEDYEGTGVGLAIVQRIVHRHGGKVWAEGEADRGATFSFSLNGGSRT